jgi:hypothetical protein
MPYFLDGNNLIGQARGTARPSEEDRQALVAELAGRLRRTKATAVLFFDGPGERRSSLGKLSIREAGRTSADEAILAEIGRSRAPREIVVVTEDRGLGSRARDLGALTLLPKEFWSRFGASERTRLHEDPARVDVEEWMRYFEDEKNRES